MIHVAPPSGVFQTAARAGFATKSVALTVSFGQAAVRPCASSRPRAVGSVIVWTVVPLTIRPSRERRYPNARRSVIAGPFSVNGSKPSAWYSSTSCCSTETESAR